MWVQQNEPELSNLTTELGKRGKDLDSRTGSTPVTLYVGLVT